MPEEAVESAEHALRLSPRDPLVGSYASNAMALAHFAAGHYADGVASGRKTIERSPEYLPGHIHFIAAAAMQGDVEATAEALSTLVRLRPEFSIAWVRENMAYRGEVGERLLEALRKAGVPEE